MSPTKALLQVLTPAFAPCQEFHGTCNTMRWAPDAGHVPRGFYGALGTLAEVELILVFAEPGDPHPGEQHSGLQSAFDYAGKAFGTGMDLFHRNVRSILDSCWPELSFTEQMRKTWMTESVLCSAKKEGGSVPMKAAHACSKRYLKKQIELMPAALVVALGTKAETRLSAIGVENFLAVSAAAPPGANRPKARESWKAIPKALMNTQQQTSG